MVAWPPQPGGTNVTAAHPQAESQPVVREVHVASVRDKSIRLSCTFQGNVFTYDVQTKDDAFARKLAVEFSKYVGYRLEQLGDLEIDF
jgi:hypothetical protein